MNTKIAKSYQIHRDISLDAVCGIYIIYMIIGHAGQWAHISDDDFFVNTQNIFFMFMPWFFYKSGMFHQKCTIKFTITHNANKLLKPFIIYTLVGEIFYWIDLYGYGTLNWKKIVIDPVLELLLKGSCNGNLPLWFLISLFIVKCIVSLVDHLNCKYLQILILAALAAGGGTIISSKVSHIPLYLLNVPLGLLFYMIGIYMNKVQYKKLVLFIAIIIFVVISCTEPSFVGFRSNEVIEGFWILGIVNSVAGIIIFNNIFRLSFLQLPVLTEIGRNSLDYYCSHWIVFSIVVNLYNIPDLTTANYNEFYLLLVACALVIPCYSYWRLLAIEKISGIRK